MNVTGVEVIRRNPGTAAIGVVAGEKIELTYGDTLKVNVSFDYRGLAGSATLYGAIGNRGWAGFGEKLHNEVSIDLPESLTEFTPCERSVDIPITSDIDPGTDYDLYVKLSEYPEAGMPEVDNVIDIVGIPPTYELLEEIIYPYAYVYDGPTEGGTITFKTDPFTPSSWIAGRLAAHAEDEIKKQGGRMLEMRVYVDKSPLLWADWRIDVISAPPETTAGLGMPIGFTIPVWVAIILVVLALIALIIVTYTFIIKPLTYKHKPISPEIKATWSTETLISAIGDFEAKLIAEEKLPGPPTPPEELEEKSDDELRVYTDELAEMVVPPVPDMWPLLVLGGVGILGLGGIAAAYAMTKPTGE